MPLSDRGRGIVLGSLLGDGSIAINKRYKNARFSFRHAASQKEYFFWKAQELSEITAGKSVWEQYDEDGQGGFGGKKLRFQSAALPELTEIFNLVTRNGKKCVRRKWLNRLTPLSLAVWWMDDGSIVTNGRKGVLCTDGFSHEEVKIMQKYFRKVWGIETKIGETNTRGRHYYRLYIRSTQEFKQFLRLIIPHIPVEEMLTKVLLLYKDSKLQQRWISEVTELSQFPRETVEKHLAIKKSKWKHYRE